MTTGAPSATDSPTATGVPTTVPWSGRAHPDPRAGNRLPVPVGHVGQAAGIGKMLGSSDTDATAAWRSASSMPA